MVVDDTFDELLLMSGEQGRPDGASEQSSLLHQRIWVESGVDLDLPPSSDNMSSHSSLVDL